MNRSLLLVYQWAIGLSDTLTGVLLYLAPAFTLSMMRVHAPLDTMPYIGYIGAFVLSTGLACIYGAVLLQSHACSQRIETVWLLTAFSRAAVAVYVLQAIAAGRLETAWITVALFDGACVLVQGIGLRRGWLKHAR
jgi:hypothetical protein